MDRARTGTAGVLEKPQQHIAERAVEQARDLGDERLADLGPDGGGEGHGMWPLSGGAPFPAAHPLIPLPFALPRGAKDQPTHCARLIRNAPNPSQRQAEAATST